jgi:hypothetical protein
MLLTLPFLLLIIYVSSHSGCEAFDGVCGAQDIQKQQMGTTDVQY